MNIVASIGQVFHLRDRTIALRAEHSVLTYKIAIGGVETCEITSCWSTPSARYWGISNGKSR
ncbi:AidA [Pseudomonas chlororaphis subsp. piscium]|nr:AidA [Pseudomonas chlororaphis subsp. piscium]